jgi:alcohol dehydrogenase class IV
MTPFALGLPRRIAFGAGTADQLGAITAGLGARVFLVTGSSPHRLASVTAGLPVVGAAQVRGEPTLQDAREAAEAARAARADVVVAVGGGSAIDLGKAVAMLLGNGGDPLDYLEVVGRGMPITAPSAPFVAVPTTAGTGAEATANAVLASPEHGLKASLRSGSMVPDVALVDPLLTLGCPPAVTAASGLDALTQCLEPYLSSKANPVTDGWARTGLMAAGRSLRTACAEGADVPARTDMALASLLGGLCLANAKLGAVHGFAGPLGGMVDAPHGALCAALLVPVCRANLARADAALRSRFDDVGRWLTGRPDAAADDALAWLAQTVAQLGVPGLAAFGLTGGDTAEVVEKAAGASSMAGNPVLLRPHELAAVFREALQPQPDASS